MTRKILSFFAAMVIGLSMTFAQDDMSVIGDEMTNDPEQNAQWREGQNPYPAKPKSMWELSLYGGATILAGDVDASPSWNAGLTFRKALNYVLSIRFGGNYANYKGYDSRASSYASISKEQTFTQNVAEFPELRNYEGSVLHRNYETKIAAASVEMLVSFGNILFHRPDPYWNGYIGIGVGGHSIDAGVNFFDDNGASTGGSNAIYNFESVNNGTNPVTSDERKTSRDALKELLDDSYELTAGTQFGDDKSSGIHGLVSLGSTWRLGGVVNLGIEYQMYITGNDLLDGFTANSRSADLLNQFNVRLGFNLGSKEKRVKPLYWVNPLDATANDIAELKQRPKFDLTDSDGDGVIDMIDQERETPAGCPVDTRGIILDSDGDGVPDCKDEEPFSPPGYTVNDKGVANVTTPYLTESEIRTIVNERPLPKTDWFLPMIHFDLDKYYVKPMYYGQLHNIATVAKAHPNLNFVANGFSDNRGTDEYNAVLAYNRSEAAVNYIVEHYGVSRDRFVLQYGGDDMVQGLPDTYNTTEEEEKGQYMNRRVEFKIAADGDSEMSRPEGEAGSDTPGSSRTGSKYSGNRSSGY